MNESEWQHLLKSNAIRLVKHHKNICDDPACGIVLYWIRILIERAGVKLTDEEKKVFY